MQPDQAMGDGSVYYSLLVLIIDLGAPSNQSERIGQQP